MIIDGRGRLVWFHQLAARRSWPPTSARSASAAAPVLTWWQGPVTFSAFGTGEGVIADPSYRTMRTVRAGNGYHADLHEFLLTAGRRRAADELLADPRPPARHRRPARSRRCSTRSCRRSTSAPGSWSGSGTPTATSRCGDSYATPANSAAYDAYHLNSIQPLPGGRVLISARDTSAVYLVDRRTRADPRGRSAAGQQLPPRAAAPASTSSTTPSCSARDRVRAVRRRGGAAVRGAVLARAAAAARPAPPHRAASLQQPTAARATHARPERGQHPAAARRRRARRLRLHAVLLGVLAARAGAVRRPAAGRRRQLPRVPLPLARHAAHPPGARASARTGAGRVSLYASWNGATDVARWQVLAPPGAARPRDRVRDAIACQRGQRLRDPALDPRPHPGQVDGVRRRDVTRAAMRARRRAVAVALGRPRRGRPGGIHKIRHVVVIMQENRSFDSYFGTYPGRRRHPDAPRRADRLRAGSAAPHAACARSTTRTTSTTAARTSRAPTRPTTTTAGWTASSARGEIVRQRARPEGLQRQARRRHDGLPRRRARSPTTGPTRATTCSRTTCSSPTRPGACPPTCSSSRSGRRCACAPGDPFSCSSHIEIPDLPAGLRARAAHHAELRLDRPHLPAAPPRRQLGLLPQEGPGARLRDRRDVLHASATRIRARPGSGTRCPASPPSGRTTSSRNIRDTSAFLAPRAHAATCRPCPGSSPAATVSEHPTSSIRAGQALRHEPDQHDRPQPRLEEHGDLPGLGRLGRLLRPRRAARRSTSTATASASRACVISPYARAALHRSPAAELRRLREVHRGRLPRRPAAEPEDRRPPRPAARRCARTRPGLGDLRRDFDFSQAPRPPLILPTHPHEHRP